MPFEVSWDKPKRLSNIEEHGVDFRDAALILRGLFSVKKTRGRTMASRDFALWEESTTIIMLSPTHGAARFARSAMHGR
jgi:uncharacterized DUF497 family protein